MVISNLAPMSFIPIFPALRRAAAETVSVCVRRPIRPDFRADVTTGGTRHAATERANHSVIRQRVHVHRGAVAALEGIAAVDEDAAAAVASNVAEGD
jgi:hypothetical protein